MHGPGAAKGPACLILADWRSFTLDTRAAAEELKTFVLMHGLPKTDMALFGIKCPYCGKSDRVRQLEEPAALSRKMDAKQMAVYFDLWGQLTRSNESLAVCKFCQNLLLLQDKASALPLHE
jgi:hypothetical protein